jgi:hypothetical protein
MMSAMTLLAVALVSTSGTVDARVSLVLPLLPWSWMSLTKDEKSNCTSGRMQMSTKSLFVETFLRQKMCVSPNGARRYREMVYTIEFKRRTLNFKREEGTSQARKVKA